MPRTWTAAGVFLAAFLLLLSQTSRTAVGLGYEDPVDSAEAVAENIHSHAALRMAAGGPWHTPVFQNRFLLSKPPLLYWLSAASVRAFGIAPWTLRMPSLLAAAGICALVFLWTARMAGGPSGLAAASLLLTSSLFVNFAGRNMTAMPATFAVGLAVYLLTRDPALARRASWIGFGSATAAAVLTAGSAGLVPVLVLLAFRLAARPGNRPRWQRVLGAAAVTALAALPWFVYQIAAHPAWFRIEFVRAELFSWGTVSSAGSAGNAAWFYAVRLLRSSPALSGCAVAALIFFADRLRRRDPATLVLAAWIGVAAAAVFSPDRRDAAHLLPLMPALAVMAATNLPMDRLRTPASLVLLLIWLTPFLQPSRSPPDSTASARRLLEQRCKQGRNAELIIVSTVDRFYAALLPFSAVRYALPEVDPRRERLALAFGPAGIAVTVDEFLHLASHRNRFTSELSAWGLPDTKAMATFIVYPDTGSLARLVRESPGHDFLIPSHLRGVVPSTPHRIAGEDGGHLLLEGNLPSAAALPGGPCQL